MLYVFNNKAKKTKPYLPNLKILLFRFIPILSIKQIYKDIAVEFEMLKLKPRTEPMCESNLALDLFISNKADFPDIFAILYSLKHFQANKK